MARLLWLADVLRAAGLTVVEHSGWRTRGVEFDPRGVIIHQTRGPIGSSESGEINVLINGRVGLSGPISQLFVGRDGDWHVIASGRCNHVTVGDAGPFKGVGNSNLIGIEEHWTIGDPYPDVQHASYVRGVAAIIRHTGWPPPVGHKEHQPAGKSDPHFDMHAFRRDVAASLNGDDMSADSEGKIRDIWFAMFEEADAHKRKAGSIPGLLHSIKTGQTAIDYDKLADAIVAKLPPTTLTAADVRAAMADVLLHGVATEVP